jgi:Transposase
MTDHTPISQVSRLEVISTGARRRWTLAEKQRIVAESYSAPQVVSATARRNGLSARRNEIASRHRRRRPAHWCRRRALATFHGVVQGVAVGNIDECSAAAELR